MPPQGTVVIHNVLLVHEEVSAAADVAHGETQPLHLLAQVPDHVHGAHLQRHRRLSKLDAHLDPLLVPGPAAISAAAATRRHGGLRAHDGAHVHAAVGRRAVVRQRLAVLHLRLVEEERCPRGGQRAVGAVLEELLEARHGVGGGDLVEHDAARSDDLRGRDGDADNGGVAGGGGGRGRGRGWRRVVGEDEDDAGALDDAVVRGVARVVELLLVVLLRRLPLPPGEEEPLRRHGDALARVDRLLHLPHRREVPHLDGELPSPRRRERHVHLRRSRSDPSPAGYISRSLSLPPLGLYISRGGALVPTGRGGAARRGAEEEGPWRGGAVS